MFDALMRGALAAVNLTPEEANALVRDAFEKVDQIDARLARIERALNIKNVTPAIIDVTTEESEHGDGTQQSA